MDAQWFKARQRQLGVTSFDIGQALGRDRTIVSRILNGRQRLAADQVDVFADLLRVDRATIEEKAGLRAISDLKKPAQGFEDGEAALWSGIDGRQDRTMLSALGLDGAEIWVWRLKTHLLDADGFKANDFLAVDHSADGQPADGDIVVAQVYDNQLGTAETVVRRYAPPVLLTSHPSEEGRKVSIVDEKNVSIRGRVVASWRV